MQDLPLGDEGDVETLEKKQFALECLREAWAEASVNGIESEIVSFAALFTAMSDLVSLYGEEQVSKMAESLPERIETGEFSISRSLN